MPPALLGRPQVEMSRYPHPEKRSGAASRYAGDSAPPPAQGIPWHYCTAELAMSQYSHTGSRQEIAPWRRRTVRVGQFRGHLTE